MIAYLDHRGSLLTQDRRIVARIFEYSSTNARIGRISGDFQSEGLEFLIYDQTHFFRRPLLRFGHRYRDLKTIGFVSKQSENATFYLEVQIPSRWRSCDHYWLVEREKDARRIIRRTDRCSELRESNRIA